MLELLKRWKARGLNTPEEINDYVERVNRQNSFIRKLKETWGVEPRASERERQMVAKWTGEYHLSTEYILHCAAWSADANHPMAYLDAMIDSFVKDGVTTIEGVDAGRTAYHQSHPPKTPGASAAPRTKVVTEQQYTQRPDGPQQGQVDWLARFLQEVNEYAE